MCLRKHARATFCKEQTVARSRKEEIIDQKKNDIAPEKYIVAVVLYEQHHWAKCWTTADMARGTFNELKMKQQSLQILRNKFWCDSWDMDRQLPITITPGQPREKCSLMTICFNISLKKYCHMPMKWMLHVNHKPIYQLLSKWYPLEHCLNFHVGLLEMEIH